MGMTGNPHPKDLSKSPAFAGFFVSPYLFLHSADEKDITNTAIIVLAWV
jgi:hypothetical protein